MIAAKGHEVIVSTRDSYVNDLNLKVWKGVRLGHTHAPRKKSIEAIFHTFLSVIKAKRCNPDILHVHAVGPALMVPFARLLGMKVVFTHHGPDYDRQKWGGTAKLALRMGEWFGGLFASEVIVISSIIESIIKTKCWRNSNLVYNGVPIPNKSDKTDFLQAYSVEPGRYILAVARFVPEKGLHLLTEAFQKLNEPGIKLVIAGDADHETTYSRELKSSIANDPRIVSTGYITGEPLNQVYSHAGLFVLPSFHEGLPIALLEAMSYDLPVLVSDIAANREVDLPEERFFKCGDVHDLQAKLEALWDKGLTNEEQWHFQSLISEKYNWEKIASQTIEVYKQAIGQRGHTDDPVDRDSVSKAVSF